MQEVLFQDLGRIDYQSAWDYQEQLLQQNVRAKSQAIGQLTDAGERPADTTSPGTVHHLLLLEHPPVYTLGKSGRPENILITDRELHQKNISFFKTNRGGDITFHGPEQIVGYPILDLERFYRDIGRYLRDLEEVIIRTMAEYGLKGDRSPGETGVWIEPFAKGRERKICALGVRCSRWITMHGFAFNINTDLDYFENIIPCGIRNKQVTSLQKELGQSIPVDEVKVKIKRNFETVFDVTLKEAEPGLVHLPLPGFKAG